MTNNPPPLARKQKQSLPLPEAIVICPSCEGTGFYIDKFYSNSEKRNTGHRCEHCDGFGRLKQTIKWERVSE